MRCFVNSLAASRLRACDGLFLFLYLTIVLPDEWMITLKSRAVLCVFCVSLVNSPRRASENQLNHCSDAVVDLIVGFGDGCGFAIDDRIRVGGELSYQS